MNIKEWAKEQNKETRKTIDTYIKNGINKVTAVKMVLKESCLGEGYKAQIRHDYGLSMFD